MGSILVTTLDRLMLFVSGLITVSIVVLVVFSVFMRYFIGAPLVYSYDLSTLLFAWMVFIGLYMADRQNAHLSVDILEISLPAHLSHLLKIIRLIFLIVLSMFMAWIGSKLLLRAGMDIPSMRISIKWLYASLPIGFFLLAVSQIISLVSHLRHPQLGKTAEGN